MHRSCGLDLIILFRLARKWSPGVGTWLDYRMSRLGSGQSPPLCFILAMGLCRYEGYWLFCNFINYWYLSLITIVIDYYHWLQLLLIIIIYYYSYSLLLIIVIIIIIDYYNYWLQLLILSIYSRALILPPIKTPLLSISFCISDKSIHWPYKARFMPSDGCRHLYRWNKWFPNIHNGWASGQRADEWIAAEIAVHATDDRENFELQLHRWKSWRSWLIGERWWWIWWRCIMEYIFVVLLIL